MTAICRRLDSIVEFVGGGTPSRKVPEHFKGNIPWVSPKDVKSWNIVDSEEHISEVAVSSSTTRVVNPGAVLLVIRSGVLKHTLPVAINRVPIALNQDMKALVCGGDVHPDYLAYYLKANEHRILQRVRGTTADNIPTDTLRAIEVPTPPLPEQRRIAAILDKADSIRRKRAKGIWHTEELLRSTFLDMFGDPVKKETGWPVVKVQEAGHVQLGRQRAPKYQSGKHTRPYLRVANVFEDRIDLSDVLSMDFDDSDFKTYRLRHGDILLNEGQSTELVGRPAMWREELPECCFQNTLIRFRADPERMEPE